MSNKSGNWVYASNGTVPGGAVLGGVDVDGKEVYVARAEHAGATVPGKLVPSHGHAYIPWGGEEISKTEYQVLVDGPHRWVSSSGSNIPSEAIPGGRDGDETVYVGRAQIQGSLTVGKVHPSHGCCYVPYGGKEHRFTEYEILTF
ncbi:natterin-4-like [Anticarsia gemmatalis]|uniref:natterin-4-like n=1 Tax=Anticarsia gemmatalis TaxID=129554 RepID=UPI003F775250